MYKGPYSDDSSDWTPELLKEAEHEFKNDGRFYLPFSIYFKYFTGLSVNYYLDYAQIIPYKTVMA